MLLEVVSYDIRLPEDLRILIGYMLKSLKFLVIQNDTEMPWGNENSSSVLLSRYMRFSNREAKALIYFHADALEPA